MGDTSKTGLLASATKKLSRTNQINHINLKVVATSAPYVLKPFAGLYNPYPYGCSLLCNHPADTEARELLKRAKDTWATEGKNLLLSDEVDAIRASLNQLQVKITDYCEPTQHHNNGIPIGSVPEELFRRYTDTDSRPLTPAPTLVSAHTRASGSRRCVTPDPMLNADVREKTQLILDLRRSHSQETLSWYGGLLQQDVPSITIVQLHDERKSPYPSICCTPEPARGKYGKRSKTPSPIKSAKSDQDKVEKTYLKVTAPQDDDNSDINEEGEEEEEEEGIIKRRGRKRRKRGRDASRGPPAFQSSIDPETQIATIGPESHNPSARPSLVPNEAPTVIPSESAVTSAVPDNTHHNFLDVNSYLDQDALKLLRRELNEEVIDKEFNLKKRRALEEAMKTIKPNKTICKELKVLKKDLQTSPITEKMWLSIPRMFSRSSARFELPMDSRELSAMTPLQYASHYINVSSSRKQLYNFIFNKYKNENELESEHQRMLSGRNILLALNEVMCKNMSDDQGRRYHDLMGWNEEDTIQFKTFCGLCALCERIFAPEYSLLVLPKSNDPCQEIETVDFKSLERKLLGQNANDNLVQILYAVRDS